MVGKIKKFLCQKGANKNFSFIYPLLSNGDKVLDFGCGNLLVAKYIQENLDVKITGLDVIDTNLTSLPLKIYNGKKIPFEDKSFDVTYAAFVFHHTNEIEPLLSECIRVTKRRIIILEDTYRNNFELLLTKISDCINKLMYSEMNIPFNFKKEDEWINLFNKFRLKKEVKTQKISHFSLRPTRHRLFILDLN